MNGSSTIKEVKIKAILLGGQWSVTALTKKGHILPLQIDLIKIHSPWIGSKYKT